MDRVTTLIEANKNATNQVLSGDNTWEWLMILTQIKLRELEVESYGRSDSTVTAPSR